MQVKITSRRERSQKQRKVSKNTERSQQQGNVSNTENKRTRYGVDKIISLCNNV